MTKRFLLFSGDSYYPLGGFWDCNHSFDTLEESVDFALKSDCDWYHVVDSQTMKVVAANGGSCYAEGIPKGPQ